LRLEVGFTNLIRTAKLLSNYRFSRPVFQVRHVATTTSVGGIIGAALDHGIVSVAAAMEA
jgi:hypothetical protein